VGEPEADHRKPAEPDRQAGGAEAVIDVGEVAVLLLQLAAAGDFGGDVDDRSQDVPVVVPAL
jgi:hypothetical protein